MGFNLENYEPVKIRKKRFYSDYEDGRIVPKHIIIEKDCCSFEVYLYKNSEDQKENLPLSTGHAQEFRGQGGMANKFAWLENCEESAIGRALDNAGYATDNKCSREEMIKVQRHEKELDKVKSELRALLKVKKDGLTKDKFDEVVDVGKGDSVNDIVDAIGFLTEEV